MNYLVFEKYTSDLAYTILSVKAISKAQKIVAYF